MKTSHLPYSIRTRILALILVAVLGMAAVFVLASYSISNTLFEARYEQTRRLVDAATSMIRVMVNEGHAHGVDEEGLKRHVLKYLRDMRYDDKEYFWVNDLKGNMLMHPVLASIDGKPAMDLKDARGKEIMKDFLKIVEEKGGGRYSYYWPPGKNPHQKVSYIKLYKPWGWVIGSGVYVHDIEKQIFSVEGRLGLAVLLACLLALVLAFRLGLSISKPILSLNETMQKLANGDIRVEIKELGHHDEIGAMAQTVQVFLENARRMALLEIEQKDTDNVKAEFISVVSHELRTPLTSIRGSLGLVVGGAAGELPEKAKRLLDIAYKNCERLILLINDILDIDKIASGDIRLEIEAESLNNLLAFAVESNRAYAEKFFVRYELKPLAEDVLINTDAARFQQIVANFLSNAAKFSPGGAKVDVSVSVQNCMARVSVRDYGMGIPEAFRSRLFRKFSQADGTVTRKKGGTGLGLYITKQIAEQMGGSVGYESKAGFGATFWAEFPLANCRLDEGAGSAEEELEAAATCEPDEPQGPAQLPVIVHVEPDEDFSQYLAALFHRRASLVRADSVSQALEHMDTLLPKNIPVVIALDLDVKDSEKIEELLRHAEEKNIPLLILSALEPQADLYRRVRKVLTKSKATDEEIAKSVMDAFVVSKLKAKKEREDK